MSNPHAGIEADPGKRSAPANHKPGSIRTHTVRHGKGSLSYCLSVRGSRKLPEFCQLPELTKTSRNLSRPKHPSRQIAPAWDDGAIAQDVGKDAPNPTADTMQGLRSQHRISFSGCGERKPWACRRVEKAEGFELCGSETAPLDNRISTAARYRCDMSVLVPEYPAAEVDIIRQACMNCLPPIPAAWMADPLIKSYIIVKLVASNGREVTRESPERGIEPHRNHIEFSPVPRQMSAGLGIEVPKQAVRMLSIMRWMHSSRPLEDLGVPRCAPSSRTYTVITEQYKYYVSAPNSLGLPSC
ncbi:hypothetical protein V8F20_002200 [Naviculisporaceae sp. PSN 640]